MSKPKKPKTTKQPKKREPFKTEIISKKGFLGIEISLDDLFDFRSDKDN